MLKKTIHIILFCFCLTAIAQNDLSHDVYFDTDNYNVPLTEENRLLQFIAELDSITIQKIAIYGFCDDRGSHDYNLKLSQNRANTIKNIFSKNGIDDTLITNVNGKGEILLKVLKEEEISKIRGLNRKVEIIVEKTPIVEVEPVIETPKEAPKDTVIVVDKNKPITTKNIVDGTIKQGDKIRLDNIYFKTSYSYIKPESKKTLEEVAKILIEHDNLYFTIQGHVCCTQYSRDAVDKQTKKRNLSVARAKFIYDYLAKRGVNKRRMKYVGMRRKFPLGGAPEKDRRVEILITYVGQNSGK